MVQKRTPMMESLESRQMLAAAATEIPHVDNPTPVGLTPQQVRHAYNVDKIWFKNRKTGITYRGTGEGQTIAIVDAFDHPRITSDFKIFNKQFGLPNYGRDGKLLLQKKVAPGASFTAPVPPVDRGWAGEIALDVQWAHAIAPRAKIILVEAQSNSSDDILMAIDFARNIPGVSVVSLSLGHLEQPYDAAFDNFLTTPKGHIGGGGIPGGVTFVASSGDNGNVTSWPAVSKNALGVGGTTLTVDAVGNVASEIAWSGSGGGPPLFAVPNNSPDVSMVADPATGVAIYNSIPSSFTGETGWEQIGGTSASAPMWAGLLAIVNEGRTLLKKASLDGVTDVLPWLSTLPTNNFRDIVTGSNGYDAVPGVDYVTGIGSPKAHKVTRALILWDRPDNVIT